MSGQQIRWRVQLFENRHNGSRKDVEAGEQIIGTMK